MSTMTTTDWLAYCLAKPGAWRDEPWEGDLVAKVGQQDLRLSRGGAAHVDRAEVRDREAADLWLDRYPDAVTRSPYIGAHGWNVFTARRRPSPRTRSAELIDLSYELIVAKLPAGRSRPGVGQQAVGSRVPIGV